MMTFDSIQKLGRDGIEAAMRSVSAMSSGAQTAATESADFAKRAFEQTSQATEKLLGARSLDAVVDIQKDFVRASYEGFVAQTSKMGSLTANVAKEAAAPIEHLFSKAAPTG